MDIEKTKLEFAFYEDSSFFIECVYEALTTRKESQLKWFIKNHFMQNKDCSYDTMRKCGAHWNNVAFDKLNNYDFQNYIHSLLTSANYRMISKTMEKYIDFID
jgi:outer membrane protease